MPMSFFSSAWFFITWQTCGGNASIDEHSFCATNSQILGAISEHSDNFTFEHKKPTTFCSTSSFFMMSQIGAGSAVRDDGHSFFSAISQALEVASSHSAAGTSVCLEQIVPMSFFSSAWFFIAWQNCGGNASILDEHSFCATNSQILGAISEHSDNFTFEHKK